MLIETKDLDKGPVKRLAWVYEFSPYLHKSTHPVLMPSRERGILVTLSTVIEIFAFFALMADAFDSSSAGAAGLGVFFTLVFGCLRCVGGRGGVALLGVSWL